MENKRKYWRSIGELENPEAGLEASRQEFPEELPLDAFLSGDKLSETQTSRRDFLKFLGFSVGAASLAACETPVIHSIPYVVKPEEVTPGIANWYATTYYDGHDYASVLVKTREGRPIHIMGNPVAPRTGAVNARINSSVLSLYDSNRLRNPLKDGQEAEWRELDKEISSALASAGRVVLLSNSIISPSTKKVIRDFGARYPGFTHITYDAVSYSGLRKAWGGIIPDFDFSKARTIVSIGADFLNNWINGVQHMKAYGSRRRPDGEWMSKHIQFETNLSLSGSNADIRVKIKPSEYGKVAAGILGALNGGSTGDGAWTDAVKNAAAELRAAGNGNSLVVCGSNNPDIQSVVRQINERLGNVGTTVNTSNPVYLAQGDDQRVMQLVQEMKGGSVGALILYGVNPVYTLPNGAEFAEALGKVNVTISFSDRADETASRVKYICPDHHYLEAWNDYQPMANTYGVAQPAIRPLFNTRAAQDSLLRWSGAGVTYYDMIRGNWQGGLFAQSGQSVFDDFWNTSVHNGYFESTINAGLMQAEQTVNNVADTLSATAGVTAATEVTTPAATPVSGDAAGRAAAARGGEWELALYMSTAMGNGSQGNNPWLHELPDPVTRITWDNYITMSPADMQRDEFGFSLLERGDYEAHLAEVTVNGVSAVLPVVPVPGQARGTIGIALGYGRTMAGKAGNEVGKNAFPFVGFGQGTFSYENYDVQLAPAGGRYEIAATQTHHTMMGRDIVKETILPKYKQDPAAGNVQVMISTAEGLKKPEEVDLWRDHPIKEVSHRWGMSIDLNACIGCGTCVTACTSENNVPVVGKEEVRRARDMHWLRIDRYFTSDADPVVNNNETDYTEMEVPSENPQVVFQPVMCQHCNHAPCETVCPVAATTHSMEGLNQMTYNRCIGTRYCANNCPYKVRRFNWFNYIGNDMFADVNPSQDDVGRMVLNPDVVVRSRGVIEKCSLCVQRIQAGKLEAKKQSRMVVDGDIETACAAACPTNAITFGDLNDDRSNNGNGSTVRQHASDPRAYNLLNEIGTRPNIYYLTKVRNLEENQVRTGVSGEGGEV